MNLSRWGFLRLLGALAGVGQVNDGKLCLSDTSPLRSIPCEPPCKEGEERCPLGHCQKPQYIAEMADGDDCTFYPKIDWEATKKESESERAAGIVTMEPKPPCTPRKNSKLQACSACGIVYVPRKEGKS